MSVVFLLSCQGWHNQIVVRTISLHSSIAYHTHHTSLHPKKMSMFSGPPMYVINDTIDERGGSLFTNTSDTIYNNWVSHNLHGILSTNSIRWISQRISVGTGECPQV